MKNSEGDLIEERLSQAIQQYLLWMMEKDYAALTIENYGYALNRFLDFVLSTNVGWDDVFAEKIVTEFIGTRPKSASVSASIRGLWRYLYEQKIITNPPFKPVSYLPDLYETYLLSIERNHSVRKQHLSQSRRVLTAFYSYLNASGIEPADLTIEYIDDFWARFAQGFSKKTCINYRSHLRSFLRYLYHSSGTLKRDLARLIVSAPMFTPAAPPRFIRPDEVKKLFASVDRSTSQGLRTSAMVHLAYSLGLRLREICLITLDDLSFRKAEVRIRERKCNNPMILPVPEETLKAVAAYIVGGRPKSTYRSVFLTLKAPHRPISPNMVGYHLRQLLKKAQISANAGWLRHTYAQNLLESGTSLFEIKEMMGHETIDSSYHYLHIHTTLMREVLFNE